MIARKRSACRAATEGAAFEAASRGCAKREGLNFTALATSPSCPDDHLCGHVRVQGAEITELARLGEGETEAVAGVETLRLEAAVGRDDRMRNVVVVDPRHRSARPD